MNKVGNILEFIICVILSALLLSWIGVRMYERTNPRETQYVTVYDTIPCYYPVPRDSVVIRYVQVKLPIAHEETENQAQAEPPAEADSVAVEIPITQKVYSDSLYTAYVSGFNPSLDSITVYHQVHTRTVEKKTYPRWSIGVQAGYGMQLNPNVAPHLVPYIGIGLTYNIFTF